MLQRRICGIIEQMVLHDQVRSRSEVVSLEYGHKENQLAKVYMMLTNLHQFNKTYQIEKI